MNKVNIILEDNREKFLAILDLYGNQQGGFFHNPILFFMKQQDAIATIRGITENKSVVMYTLYLDDELIPGGGNGISFLNWMIDNYPSQIEKVVITSYRDGARKEMTELCSENLIATELFPLPFASR